MLLEKTPFNFGKLAYDQVIRMGHMVESKFRPVLPALIYQVLSYQRAVQLHRGESLNHLAKPICNHIWLSRGKHVSIPSPSARKGNRASLPSTSASGRKGKHASLPSTSTSGRKGKHASLPSTSTSGRKGKDKDGSLPSPSGRKGKRASLPSTSGRKAKLKALVDTALAFLHIVNESLEADGTYDDEDTDMMIMELNEGMISPGRFLSSSWSFGKS